MTDTHAILDKILISTDSEITHTVFLLEPKDLISLIDDRTPYVLKGTSLLPPRLPVNIQLKDDLVSKWPDIKQHVLAQAEYIQPAVKHAILSFISSIDDVNVRKSMVSDIAPIFSVGDVYQGSVTWASTLAPSAFEKFNKFSVTIKGGNIIDAEKGVSCTVVAAVDKLKLNPVDLYTSDKIISAKDALALNQSSIPLLVDTLSKLDYVPNTSMWVYGLIDDMPLTWERISLGGALFSPFFNTKDINDLFSNLVSVKGPGFFTRPGDGIADIISMQQDHILYNFLDFNRIYDVPLTINNMCSIKHAISHQNTFAALSFEWLDTLHKKIELAEGLDILPEYSVFNDQSVLEDLKKLSSSHNLDYFDAAYLKIISAQAITCKKYNGLYTDVCNIGIPEDVSYFKRINEVTPQSMEL